MRFWNFFRLVFVIFSLYLTGDAFYRWDAFKFYASFSEFVPAVALMSILWSILAVLTAFCAWVLLKTVQSFFLRLNIRTDFEHMMMFAGLFILLGAMVWGGKRLLWPLDETSALLKTGTLISVMLLSVALSWVFRDNAYRWMEGVNERITPLVWLYGIVVIISIPFVGYLALSGNTGMSVMRNTAEFSNPNRDRPNIILVTFDALTAQDMSVYGSANDTTPFISEWAKSATVFTRHEASANYTAPATATLMTGKRVWSHRRFQSNAGAPVKSDTESLPLLLKKHGYYNMAFVANNLASVQMLGMAESFMVAPFSNEFMSPSSVYGFLLNYLHRTFGTKIKLNDWILSEDFILHKLTPDNYIKYPSETEFPVEKVFGMFLSEIDGNMQAPYFAWIHLFPPHAPYLPPHQYSGQFDLSPAFRTWKEQYRFVRKRYYNQSLQPDADVIRSRYDEFILYCDNQFQRFIEEMEKRSQLNNTVIIVSSDHGESFEHGYFTHGGPFLFEQMTHLPLIIKEPGQTEGKVIDVPVEQVDIPVTILDIAGISEPPWMEGRSLIPLIRGEDIAFKPVFSMNLDKNPVLNKITKGTIAVWKDKYKLIHYLGNEKSLLFNIEEDPDEMNNLIDTKADVGRHMLGMIKTELKKVNEKFDGEKR
jgi:arylsulfatase A-like enzyme